MKVRAILEFDLEDEAGAPITDRREYAWAADITREAIRSRMMGDGFLPDDTIIGTYTVTVRVVENAAADGALMN